MSTVIAPVEHASRQRRRDRRAERRRLDRQDRRSARLAELHAISALLEQSAELVSHGWVQGSWFSVDTPRGEQAVTAYGLRLTDDHTVVGACLVGSVVEAAGGPKAVRSQLVQRTLDLVWHALAGDPDGRVRWCPGPSRRMLQVLELTSWNDAPGRTQGEVVDLLQSARAAALRDADRVRRSVSC